MKPKLRTARFVLVAALTLYTNVVLTNVVSYRQYWYTQKYNNGTAMTPLYDSFFMDWIHGYDIPVPSTITLRDMVDVCTYSWCCCVCSRGSFARGNLLSSRKDSWHKWF